MPVVLSVEELSFAFTPYEGEHPVQLSLALEVPTRTVHAIGYEICNGCGLDTRVVDLHDPFAHACLPGYTELHPLPKREANLAAVATLAVEQVQAIGSQHSVAAA